MTAAWEEVLTRSWWWLSKKLKSCSTADAQVVSKQGHHKRRRWWGGMKAASVSGLPSCITHQQGKQNTPGIGGSYWRQSEHPPLMSTYRWAPQGCSHAREARPVHVQGLHRQHLESQTNFLHALALKWWQYFFFMQLSLAGNVGFHAKVLSRGSPPLQ